MPKFTAILEQAEDTTWSAYTLSPSVVFGTGGTREEALDDLRVAMAFWLDHLKQTGQTPPSHNMEVVAFEVAA